MTYMKKISFEAQKISVKFSELNEDELLKLRLAVYDLVWNPIGLDSVQLNYYGGNYILSKDGSHICATCVDTGDIRGIRVVDLQKRLDLLPRQIEILTQALWQMKAMLA